MPRLTRRRLMIGGAAVLLAGGAALAAGGRNLFYAAMTESVQARQIDVVTAHEMALNRELLLVDIRRPDEWRATGSPEGAVRLDMRRPDFIERLSELTAGDRSKPVALICARGVRSARMTNRLVRAGFTQVIDVPEGMLGSAAGPGWLRSGLPVERQ